MIYYKKIYKSPLGDLSLVADESGLVGAWFLGQKYFERGLSEVPILGNHPFLDLASNFLDAYFSGQQPNPAALPLSAQGTDFQQRIWAYLQTIPYGQTVTYGQLAQELKVKSAQAVGGAVGRNPLSILVPCHRVLGSQGQLTGYAGGLDKKIWLLEHEGVRLDRSTKVL
ncbi:methylated-DNA--[protein]-cysteine S-methyltransferase [Streptococcus sinensis]|uniref:Methylated-DNA--protein-cysteine methyltransferase n=1 Tax=Streptococcus sinensis TaxID=176090 RepID=A0A0A0DIJ3_9STRE|nr:methylated-DNA--[protein]-cysteine S-methyltransferase [Streptococcus sinensis]KGM37708.1 Methylated-DNA--protein-cysteine methyltransferase [Streptococcus sinensis]